MNLWKTKSLKVITKSLFTFGLRCVYGARKLPVSPFPRSFTKLISQFSTKSNFPRSSMRWCWVYWTSTCSCDSRASICKNFFSSRGMNDWIRVIAANKRNRLQIYARAVINLNKSISLIDKWRDVRRGSGLDEYGFDWPTRISINCNNNG